VSNPSASAGSALDELIARDKVDPRHPLAQGRLAPGSGHKLPAPDVLITEIQEADGGILKTFGELAAGLDVEPLEPADVG